MPTLPLPDEQPIAVNALRNKRAEILGDLVVHQAAIDRLRAELIHIDAVLRLFDPDTNPEEIGGKRRFPRRTEYFGRGEVTRLIYDALRDNGTVSAAELAEAVATQKEIPETDRAIRREITDRFLNMLHHLRRRGHLEKIGHGPGVRWKLSPKEPDLL
jgi:predicted metal-dependent HD superfamily phosphohydrolase